MNSELICPLMCTNWLLVGVNPSVPTTQIHIKAVNRLTNSIQLKSFVTTYNEEAIHNFTRIRETSNLQF